MERGRAAPDVGMLRRWGVRRAAIFVACVVLLLAAWSFRAPLGRAGLAAAVDAVTGGRAAFGTVTVGATQATFSNVSFNYAGVPLLAARRVRVAYDVRGLLTGGARRYGLEGVSIDAPDIVLQRQQDGSFVLPRAGASLGGGGSAAAAPGGSATVPLRLTVTVRDGRFTLLDRGRVLPDARRFTLTSFAASAAIDSAALSTYRATGTYENSAVTLAGRLDNSLGYARHRLRASALSLAPLANYFINTPSAAFARARVAALDVRAYAFAGRDGLQAYHVAGSARLEDGAMRVPGLLSGATGMRGRIDLYDDGIASPQVTARLGPARVRLSGGIYNWAAPQFRLGLTAVSDLRLLRSLFRFARALPLRGGANVATLLEGPVGTPLVATSVRAGALRYGAFPIGDARGRALYYAQSVNLLGVRGRYAGFDAAVEGAIDVGTSTSTQLVLAARGGTARVPYLAQAMPGGRVDGQAVLSGMGQRFEVRGTLAGSAPGTRLAGLLRVDATGDGALGPFELTRSDGGSVAGTFYPHRSVGESGFWLSARDYPMVALATVPRLPGLALVAPAFAGRLTGSLAGEGAPSHFRIAGRAAGRDVRIGSILLAAVSGDVTGGLGDMRFAGVRARGPWGRFSGDGAYAGQRLALEGGYRGDFTQLTPFTGELGATGPVAGPVTLLIDPLRTVVQTRDARTAGSRVDGLAIEHLTGTLDARHDALRVYGATARIAGGSAAAAGTLDASSRLAFSVADADAAGALHVAGLAPGRVAAIGRVALRGRAAEFSGGIAVRGARYGGVPLTGNGDVTFGKTRLTVTRADAIAGSAVGGFSGTVNTPGTRAVAYDLAVRIPATPLEPVARAVAPRLRYVLGTLGTEFRIRGRGPRWSVRGDLDVPEGSVNGLAFEALRSDARADAGGFDARAGSVLVGSTGIRFAGNSHGAQAALRLAAPHADLADFNDFFDAGDALGGRGSVAVSFTNRRSAVVASADVAIAGLHYRRFDLGDATARLNSSGSRVRGRLNFGGPSGTLATAGTLTVASAPLAELLARSRFEGTARLAGLDLGVWLPALGYQLPITGRVDAVATIGGRLGDPSVATTASLSGGTLGAFPVDRLEISAASTLRRTIVSRAELQVPSLDAQLSGSLGFGPRDPLALAVHAKTSDIATLATRLALGGLGASGSAEADVKIDGTLGAPHVAGGFDVERAALHGVAIPQALGEFSVKGRDVVLSGVEVGFATGKLALAGSVPLQIAPFGFGPPQAQIALEAAATDIDLASFAPLLPAGSALAGRIDGRVRISGTAGDPRLSGELTLASGSLRTPLETIPLEGLEARLAFSNHEIRLQHLRARGGGGGTLAASGYADLPDLVHPTQDATYDLRARADRLALNLPAYGGGQVTGSLALSHSGAQLPVLRGNLALAEATIPFSALLGSGVGGGGAGGNAALPDVALDLALVAERNVRVRSANVDIGARGSVHAGGTLVAPVLAGSFTSTGGTISYFNTVFRLLSGTVTFEPDLGVLPTLDARAITHVIDPDPNTVRNAGGSADITLGLAGPVNALTISLDSNPAYGRQQILGLLLNAPAFGATSLFGETAQNPTYYGSSNTASLSPSVVTGRSASGELSVAQEAFGIANAQFTRTLLAPFETTFAGALGLSNFNLNVDYTGNVGLSARKVLGKNINAIYDTSFGYPYRQTFGFEVKPNEFEAAQVTVFNTLGAYDLNSLTPTGYLSSFNSKVRAAQPAAGSSGFSLSIQRLFP